MQDRNIKFSWTFLRKDFKCLGYISTYHLVRAATEDLVVETFTVQWRPHYSIFKNLGSTVVLPLLAALLVLNLTCYHFANRRVTMTNVCLVLLMF